MSLPLWTTPLVIAASIYLGPRTGRALSAAFPPQQPVLLENERIRRPYYGLNVAAQLLSVAALISSAYFVYSLVPGNTSLGRRRCLWRARHCACPADRLIHASERFRALSCVLAILRAWVEAQRS